MQGRPAGPAPINPAAPVQQQQLQPPIQAKNVRDHKLGEGSYGELWRGVPLAIFLIMFILFLGGLTMLILGSLCWTNLDDHGYVHKLCGSRAGAEALLIVGSIVCAIGLLYVVGYIHLRVLRALLDYHRRR